MKIEEFERILELVNASNISELTLKVGDIELVARKGNLIEHSVGRADGLVKHSSIAEPGDGVTVVEHSADSRSGGISRSSPQATNSDYGLSQDIVIKAPMLGIFYRAPSPGAPPFAEVGQLVKEGDTVGTIEVMKLFSSLASPSSGRIKEFLVENSELVEHGQPLVVLEAIDE